MSHNVRDWMTAQEANEYDRMLAELDARIHAIGKQAQRLAQLGNVSDSGSASSRETNRGRASDQ